MMTFTVGIDIGGTFTDCVVLDESGRVTITKASSTPPDFETGVMDAIGAGAHRLGVSLNDLLRRSVVLHGCTVGTNALVEGRTANTGVLVSAGHVETLVAMQGGYRNKDLPPEVIAAGSRRTKSASLVDPGRVGEIHERIASDGVVLAELDEQQVRDEVVRLRAAGAEAFAVGLLWSVVNDTHERAVRRIIEEIYPEAFVSLSSEVVPRVGEYERITGTIVNSLVGPPMKAYLEALVTCLLAAGYEGHLGIMSCWGGLIDADTATRFPILTIGSGPAAGVVGARALCELRDASDDVITADMGGTSLDVGLILDKKTSMRTTTHFGQFEYVVPTVDVRSIGAGGGSLIRFDEVTGTFRVGPESAGSRPGPVAFMRGGTVATVTDADLVLGYLNPDFFLGGTMSVSLDAARRALEAAGAPLGYSAEQTAAAAARIVDNKMADAVRLMTVNEGRDARRMAMYAFGGNGAVHASALANALGISRVVVPMGTLASGWSAFGVASSDAVVLEELGQPMAQPFDPFLLEEVWEALEKRALNRLTLQGVTPDNAVVQRLAEMKYATQVHAVTVEVGWKIDRSEDVKRLVEAFDVEYERRYGEGTGYPAAGCAILSLAVRASAALSNIVPRVDGTASDGSLPRKGNRDVIWYELGTEPASTPIYDGDAMSAGMTVDGPAIIEFTVTTLVLRPGQRASVDKMRNVNIEVGSAAE
jgi:N-methylhydantoinase A